MHQHPLEIRNLIPYLKNETNQCGFALENEIILRSNEKINLSPLVTYLRKWVLKSIFTLFVILMICPFAQAQTDPLYFSPGEDLLKKTAKYLFLKVKTNKKKAFVGEYISAWYYLYVAVDIQGKLTKSPSYTGFASYDVEGGNTDAYEIEKINGIPFRVYLVKQVQLYGLRPGVQRLEPVELEASIRYRKISEKYNTTLFESQPNDTIINYTLKSTPLEINIKGLPKDGSGSFSGAVGSFEISAFASKNNISADKADTIYWLMKGSGNWHEVILPTPKWAAGMEVFEPIGTDNINPFAIPVEGLRTIGYPVVFNQKGTYVVAPVSFTFFNPVLQQYKTIKSDSIRIEVTEAQRLENVQLMEKNENLTTLFSRYAIIVFPLSAFILLGLLFYKRKKS